MSVSMLTRVSSQPSELAQPARMRESRGHAPFNILYNVSFMSLLFGLSSVQLAEQVFPKQFPFVRLSSLHSRISAFQFRLH